MPSPEAIELRARTDEQLASDLDEAHQALFNLRFQGATHQLADNSQVSKARRRIARIHTLLREREILAELDAEIEAVDGAPAAVAVAERETPAGELADETAEDDAPAEAAPSDAALADELPTDEAAEDATSEPGEGESDDTNDGEREE